MELPPPIPPSVPESIPPIIPKPPRPMWTPVASGERINTLDALRGCALFGILTINMLGFSWPIDMMSMRQEFWKTPTDAITDQVLQFFAEGKFYPLFAFLFGLGAAIQMERAEASGTKFAGRFCRRLFILLGFGLAHALLLWDGDILVWYAAFGFLLLPFRKRQPKTVLIWALVCIALPALLMLFCWAVVVGLSAVPQFATEIQKAMASHTTESTTELAKTIRIFAHGGYGEIFIERFKNLIFMWLVGFFYLPEILGIFLLGLYACKRRLFHDVEANVGFFRRVLIWGLLAGLLANALHLVLREMSDASDMRYLWLLAEVFKAVGGPIQSMAYAAGITLLLRCECWQRWLRPIATAGRMALTNYLSQSVICTTIFYSYGLGLFGSVGRTAGLGLAVVIYAAQVVFSGWWLKRFQFGPMEWLWRTLTYWKLQPLRVRKNN